MTRDEQALAWAKANPNHPESARVRAKAEAALGAVKQNTNRSSVDNRKILGDEINKIIFGKAAGLPVNLLGQAVASPKSTFDRYGSAIPMTTGIFGGPAAPATAAAGEFARQIIGTALGSKEVPNTAGKAFANVVGQGVAANPAILGAIPGVSKVATGVKALGEKALNLGGKVSQAFTGGKANDFIAAAKKGYSAYSAPSLKEAGDQMSLAMKSKGINTEPTIEMAVDPQLTVARRMARSVGESIQKGQKVGAEQALRARQAVDRIISSTPDKDKTTLNALGKLREQFNSALSEASPEISKASSAYRDASIKKTITSPIRLNKSGQYSAISPLLSAATGALTAKSDGPKSGAGTFLLGLAGTSPALFGLGATTAGQAAKLASNPQVRQLVVNALLGGQ